MERSPASAQTKKRSVALHHDTDKTRLREKWVLPARIVCGLLIVFSIGIFVAALPGYFVILHLPCDPSISCQPGSQLPAHALEQLRAVGISLDFYAAFGSLIPFIIACVFFAVSIGIFWRKSDDRMALLAALFLVTFPTLLGDSILYSLPPIWIVLAQGVRFLGSICFSLFFYVFPNGQFVPRWTRWLMPGIVLYWGIDIFLPSTSNSLFMFVVFLAQLVSIIGAQVYRYLYVSTPLERQQTKWVVFGMSIAITGYMGSFLLVQFFFSSASQDPISLLVLFSLWYVLFLLFPLSISFSILRYRLWDIDRLINRTLVYITLTGTLALIYVGLIFALQYLLRGLINQNNDVAIVISTLAIAALFQPLRKRIQAIIDRRFYRRKYDAARTLAAFSTTLRNEVDLDQLREQLVAVVQETMQPAYVSLWLRKSDRRANREAWGVHPLSAHTEQ